MLDERRLLTCDRFDVMRVKHVTESGDENVRSIIRHPGAVTIVPFVSDDHVCLIKNFRLSVNQTLIELPAGTLEAGEDPRVAAERELAEETGYRADQWDLRHRFLLSPGILDERMHLFVARELHEGATAREPGELMENWVVPWKDAVRMVHDGTIQDAKTMIGLLLAAEPR